MFLRHFCAKFVYSQISQNLSSENTYVTSFFNLNNWRYSMWMRDSTETTCSRLADW